MSTVKLSLVAAACEGMGIGKNGKLPWQLKKEMSYFKKLTSDAATGKQNAVIMGRNTWESIPMKFRPLSNRLNIVISTTLSTLENDSYFVVKSFMDAVKICKNKIDTLDNIFVIGGYRVYLDSMKSPCLDKIYLTRVHSKFECDTFFPDFDPNNFQKIECPNIPSDTQEENGTTFTYEIYQK